MRLHTLLVKCPGAMWFNCLRPHGMFKRNSRMFLTISLVTHLLSLSFFQKTEQNKTKNPRSPKASGNGENSLARVLGWLSSHGIGPRMSLFVQRRGPELMKIKLILARCLLSFYLWISQCWNKCGMYFQLIVNRSPLRMKLTSFLISVKSSSAHAEITEPWYTHCS